MQKEREEFRSSQQNQMKSIIKQIRSHYFNFLSSLKFQNISQKKREKDYAHIEMKSEEQQLEEVPDSLHLDNIKNSTLKFEDEMAVENKGYSSLMQLLSEIKKLKDFNSSLYLALVEATPYSSQEKKGSFL